VRFSETSVAGAYLLDPEPIEDDRGFFARLWCADELERMGLEVSIAQCSVSYNRRRGTLRGMHWQQAPHEETKVVRCTRGAVYDVVADLRLDSPTLGRWAAAELSASNRRLLYVPAGCAHGFQTLEDDTEVTYAISAFHAPEAARGFRFDDPAFSIEWPLPAEVIASARDLSWPGYFAG
jgi:dTDP-4-dehydrorhamnose 3,5-epimerase